MNRSQNRLTSIIVVFFAAILSFPFVRHFVNMHKWHKALNNIGKVHKGMDIDQALSILGVPDVTFVRNVRNHNVAQYEPSHPFRSVFGWDPLNGNPDIKIEFDRGKVESVQYFPDADIPFNSQDWTQSYALRRGCMTRDLLRKRLLVGKTQQEVVALLGQPGELEENSTVFKYYLGYYFTKSFEPDWLRIRFDEGGRVVSGSIPSKF